MLLLVIESLPHIVNARAYLRNALYGEVLQGTSLRTGTAHPGPAVRFSASTLSLHQGQRAEDSAVLGG